MTNIPADKESLLDLEDSPISVSVMPVFQKKKYGRLFSDKTGLIGICVERPNDE